MSFDATLTNDNSFFCATCTDKSLDEATADLNKENVDFRFFYSDPTTGGTGASSFISADVLATSLYPNNPPGWDNGENATAFRSVNYSSNEFDALEDESLIEGIVSGGNPVEWVNNDDGDRIGTANGANGDQDEFAQNNVFGVTFASGKHALIRVNTLNANNGISFDVKMEN